MNKRILLFIVMLVGLPNVGLGAVYKCTIDGVETYSQEPCGESPQLMTISPAARMNSSDNDLSEEMLVQKCLGALTNNGGFKDPESARLQGYHFDWIQDDSGARRVLQLKINAKNSYGGYGGGKYYPCYLNHSGTQLSAHQYLIYK